MNQIVIDKITDLVLTTNFANLFALPIPGIFTPQALLFELKTDKFEKWIDNLKLPIVDNLTINAVNSEKDLHEIYSKDDFVKNGYGKLVARSSAIPGFINQGFYLDGGVSANPIIPGEWATSGLLVITSQLMQPHRTIPKNRIEKLTYSWDFRSFQDYQNVIKGFSKVITLFPFIDDISSTDFALTKQQKLDLIQRGKKEALAQLEYYKLTNQSEPLKVNLALSGGGIRSISHIGIVQALLDNNIHPVNYSGTSGGSMLGVLLAGYEKMLNVPH